MACGADDDKPADQIGDEGAQINVGFLVAITRHANAAVNHIRLQKELHPRRDGGANDAHAQQQKRAVAGKTGRHGLLQNMRPTHARMRRIDRFERRDDVSDLNQANRQKDALDNAKRPARDEQPHEKRGDGHRQPLAQTEQFARRDNAREFGDDRRGIGHKHHAQSEQSPRDAELFADEFAQPFLRDGAHARGHFLHQRQNKGNGDQQKQHAVAVIGARIRIGADAASIVARQGRNQTGAERRQVKSQRRARGKTLAQSRQARGKFGAGNFGRERGHKCGSSVGITRAFINETKICAGARKDNSNR